MQVSNSRLQLTYYLLPIIRFGLLLDFSVMTVGGGVGSWKFALGALCSLVLKPTA